MNYDFEKKSWLTTAALVLCLTGLAQTTRHVSTTGVDAGDCSSSACASITYAINQSANGDDILLDNGLYTVTTTTNVNKQVTIHGSAAANVVLQGTKATGYLFLFHADGSTLSDVTIRKTDKAGAHNLIGIQATNISIQNCVFEGQYVLGDPDVSRAIELSGGETGFIFTNNTVTGLRQPGYLNASSGTISNNNISGTRGWVVDNANINFTGNSFTGNAVDIAIISGTNATYYTNLLTLSAGNNNALINDQRPSPQILGQSTVYVDGATGNNSNDGKQNTPVATIQTGVGKVLSGGTVRVNDGVYTESVIVNTNLSLISENGASNTTIDGVAASALGTVQLTPGRSGVSVGAPGHGFTILGIDGTAGLEKAALYLQGAQTDIMIEGNQIVSRGDAGLMGEYNAAINGLVINNNSFTGSTYNGTPAGDGFSAQFSLLDVPRQAVVLGGGANTTNTQNISFTNNVVSTAAGGISTTDNSGAPAAAHPQGNTLVTIDAVGAVVITGNTFDGTTTRFAEALRTRGSGSHTITGNTFNGSYPIIYSAQTSNISVGTVRAQDVYTSNTLNGVVIGYQIFPCNPATVSIADVNTVSGQADNTIFIGYGPQNVTLNATVIGSGYTTYNWSSSNGGTFPAATSITVSPTSTTTYTLTAQNSIGCSQSASITIVVKDVRDGSKKIFICHNGNTNSVGTAAVAAHLSHGDILGPCPGNNLKMTDTQSETSTLVYPNPNDGIFNVALDNQAATVLVLTDIQGRVIESRTVEAPQRMVHFDLSEKGKGVYFLQIKSETANEIIKLIVQ